MISFRQKGDFSNLERLLKNSQKGFNLSILDKYGREGVAALASATPADTGKTGSSWRYEISKEGTTITIAFCNSNIQNGVPIAVIIQYGHGTRNGGFVKGQDYINPAIRPVFENIANAAWKEVTKL